MDVTRDLLERELVEFVPCPLPRVRDHPVDPKPPLGCADVRRRPGGEHREPVLLVLTRREPIGELIGSPAPAAESARDEPVHIPIFPPPGSFWCFGAAIASPIHQKPVRRRGLGAAEGGVALLDERRRALEESLVRPSACCSSASKSSC